MRLHSIAASHIQPPINSGYLPFSEITTLVGANDSGKTTVLSFVQDALLGNDDANIGAHTIFVECESARERDELVFIAAADLFSSVLTEPAEQHDGSESPEHRGLMPRSRREGSRRTSRRYYTALESEIRRNDFPANLREMIWGLGIWSGRAIDRFKLEQPRSAADSLLANLAQLLPDEGREDDELLGALRSSNIFGLRRGWSDESWDVYWCLDSENNLTDSLKSRLLKLDYVLLGSNAVHAPVDLAMNGSPLVCVPVGGTKRNLAPHPIFLPTDTGQLVDRLADRLDQVQRIRRTAVEDLKPTEDRIWDFDTWRNLEWIEEGEGGDNPWFRLHPSGLETASGIAERINGYLPPEFPYEVRCAVWLDFEKGVTLGTDLVPREGEREASFPLDGVAEGFRPWIQFAILRAISECDEFIHIASLAKDLDAGLENWTGEPPDALKVLFGEAFQLALTPAALADAVDVLLGIVKENGDDFNVLEFDLFRNDLLFMIDEPERQLHPGMQRGISKWLRDAVLTQRGSQLLMATHSLPFMRLGPAQEITRLRKLKDGSILNSINAERSEEFVSIASDLGMDYGELLTLTKVILWVEGEHDRAVLQTLYRDRLWQHGITCVPMRSSSNGRRVVTVGPLIAEIIGLSKARSVVWFDGIRSSTIDELAEDPANASAVLERVKQERREKIEGASQEEEDACALAAAASETGQSILLSAHPHGDVFDLLAPDSIESYAKSIGLDYNHRAAMNDWGEQVRRGRRKSELKRGFLRAENGLDLTVEAMTAIAEDMVEKGSRPHDELEAIVDACERLSLEVDS